MIHEMQHTTKKGMMLQNGQSSKYYLRFVIICLWLVFTISLAIWWYIYSLRQLAQIEALNPEIASELMRNQKMLTLEGMVLIACLIAGGVALSYYVIRDLRQQRKILNFFLTFSHELKTPLSSVRLHAESIYDDLKDSEQKEIAERLLDETGRLTVQLDNSLYLANIESQKTFLQPVHMFELERQLSMEFPALTITFPQQVILYADSAALLTIFRNLCRNSITHGEAKNFTVTVQSYNKPFIELRITDNGNGFSGDYSKLGEPFNRQNSKSGNGIGLYLSMHLAEKMGGKLDINSGNNAEFLISLTLQGEIDAIAAVG